MRKNINKIIAVAIGVSVMSGSIIPAFAADTATNSTTTTVASTTATASTSVGAQSNVLTLEDAIKAAVSIDENLAVDEQKIAYQDKMNDLNKKKDDFINVNDDLEKYDDDTADTKLDQLKQQRDFDQDSLTQKITDRYNSIVTQQMQIDKATKNLDVENKKLKDAKLKQSLGIETSIDIKSSELQIQKDQNDLTTSQNKLNNAEYTFKVLTGKDVTQYTLEKDIKFEPFKIDGSVDEYFNDIVESYLKYNEEIVKINKDYYDKNYEDDNNLSSEDVSTAKDDVDTAQKKLDDAKKANSSNTDPNNNIDISDLENKLSNAKSAYTNKIAARLTYLSTKLGNYQQEVNVNNEKKQFKDNLKSYYTNLQTYEDSINYCKKEIELNNEQLSNAKLKYDLGMMTEADYNTQVVSTLQAQIDLRTAVISYNQNKEYIQKPWIASTSSSQS